MRFLYWFFSNALSGVIALLLAAFLLTAYYGASLPTIQDYDRPPVLSRAYASEGTLIGQYARERRLFTPYELMPSHLINAFVSAEDQNFFIHSGIDGQGIARATVNNLRALVFSTGDRLEGASTITQQLVRNLYFDASRTVERKLKEILLSILIERAYTKEKIIELYLNWIFLGSGSYGVGDAALRYFAKPVHQLTLAESAYLAALPKSPSNFHPVRHHDRAKTRRDWVLNRMAQDGFIEAHEAEAAKAEPLTRMDQRRVQAVRRNHFSEEVRRRLIKRFGEDRLYTDGLSVRTSLDLDLQSKAQKALLDGVFAFDKTFGWREPIAKITLTDNWPADLLGVEAVLTDLPGWRAAVVLEVNAQSARIGLRPENPDHLTFEEGRLDPEETLWALKQSEKIHLRHLNQVLEPGDVIYVERLADDEDRYGLRHLPRLQGAMVVMDPSSGRVYAMVGGTSFAHSEFNRATQALRQPGSSFKPIIYAAAMEEGFTPASIALDTPIETLHGADEKLWQPTNFNHRFLGPTTLQNCLERSCNLLSIRLAISLGMSTVTTYAKALGAYDKLNPYLSVALGSIETTVLRMAATYAAFVNGGYAVNPTMIDRVQNRDGKIVFKQETRECDGCIGPFDQGSEPPTLRDSKVRVLSELGAYQIAQMLRGAVQRGTGRSARGLGDHIGGKTGTSNDTKDAWFIGYSSDLIVTIWVGYDTPKSMGKFGTGGRVAAPIFSAFMEEVLERFPPRPLPLPPQGRLIRFDLRNGNKISAVGGNEGVIQTFREGTEPGENLWFYGEHNPDELPLDLDPGGGTGGLY